MPTPPKTAAPVLDVLSNVVSVDRLENGDWLHLLSPITEDPLYIPGPDGKPDKTRPCRALVRSYRSQAYRTKDFALQTRALAKQRRAKRNKVDEVLREDMQLERPRKFSVLLVGLENVRTNAPGYVDLTEDEKVAMAEATEYQWLVDQVMEHAFTDDNYGEAARKIALEQDGDLTTGEEPAPV